MARYINTISILRSENGNRYYSTGILNDPVESLFEYEHVARMGDRWDTLAYKYLGSATLWHVIANRNNGANGSIFIKPGTRVIIPQTY